MKKSQRNYTSFYRQRNPEKNKESERKSTALYKLKSPDKVKLTQKNKYLKRKIIDFREGPQYRKNKRTRNNWNCDEGQTQNQNQINESTLSVDASIPELI